MTVIADQRSMVTTHTHVDTASTAVATIETDTVWITFILIASFTGTAVIDVTIDVAGGGGVTLEACAAAVAGTTTMVHFDAPVQLAGFELTTAGITAGDTVTVGYTK